MENVSFSEIKDEYEKVNSQITPEKYIELVQARIETLAGLCDPKTAALLVNNDLGMTTSTPTQDPIKIKNIEPDGSTVRVIGKIINVGTVREFPRKDNSTGRVISITIADETGCVIASLWDEMVENITGGFVKVNDTIDITGQAKDGATGTQINIGTKDSICISQESVQATIPQKKISEIKNNESNIYLIVKVLKIGDVKTFNKKNGTGKLRNISLGDDSGKVNATLWNDKADLSPDIKVGDSLLIRNATAKYNDFSKSVELQIGDSTSIEKTNNNVVFKEAFVPINQVTVGKKYSIKGNIIDISEIREFSNDSGQLNSVGNIVVKDNTGQIKVTLWGKNTEIIKQIDLGMPVEIIDGLGKEGMNKIIEMNTFNNSEIRINA
ncbi:single-stranded DNA-binding protein (plasmid) [Methanomethylovorans hollandica DSM 15978]|uniref:Single-stranded DNA-binding protein n=1 Tax=Methanomethylovorans hollandica (strain DSM 15978 / NBRC 107637 / DMS1) TaxID=867904 RepID=L0KZ88_METHD|nr:OB-fold nucleic acid binding domain-containing protein [Methanomethylovorans hollandica]AGB50762.1 single-stranded DNA-binding protein [Methanomethylovorans hollandica DSM 15978]